MKWRRSEGLCVRAVCAEGENLRGACANIRASDITVTNYVKVKCGIEAKRDV